jgi:hypothetical protein
MIAKLQQIVQRVNAAANLHEALDIIVHRVGGEFIVKRRLESETAPGNVAAKRSY